MPHRKQPGGTKCAAWFSGNTSTLRTHIKRKWATHGQLYLAGCKRLGITPNHRAVPEDRDIPTSHPEHPVAVQGSLDAFVTQQPRWTKDGLLEHIIELFVTEDLVRRPRSCSSSLTDDHVGVQCRRQGAISAPPEVSTSDHERVRHSSPYEASRSHHEEGERGGRDSTRPVQGTHTCPSDNPYLMLFGTGLALSDIDHI